MQSSFYVYRHVTPSGKSYVGITTDCKRRWANGAGYRDHKYFYNAIKKYGWDNIKHEIIACGLTLDEAKTAERYNIRKYASNDPDHGYNLTAGGDMRKGSVRRAVMCQDTGEIYESIAEASMDKNISEGSILACCKGKTKTAGRMQWSYMPCKQITTVIKLNGQTFKMKGLCL